MKGTSRLWYTSPAEKWVEALPIGNGRIGAMVFGGVHEEKLALNEDTLWSGLPRRYKMPNAPEAIEKAQQLVRENKLLEAQRLIEKEVNCHFTQAYMPLGDMHIRFMGIGKPTNYVRELDIENGVHRVEFDFAGAHYVRECFISHPDQALVIRMTADRPGCISFDMEMDSQLRMLEASCIETDDGIVTMMRAVCPTNADPHYVGSGDPIYYSDLKEARGDTFDALMRLRQPIDAEGKRYWGVLKRAVNALCHGIAKDQVIGPVDGLTEGRSRGNGLHKFRHHPHGRKEQQHNPGNAEDHVAQIAQLCKIRLI